MFRIAFIFLLFAGLAAQAKHQKLELQKAIELKLVQAKVVSHGGYQGYCMKMELKNLAKDSLIVLIEAGRRLNSVDDKYQDILVVKEELIVMRKGQVKACDVKGYCCQASNFSPSPGVKYDAGRLADSNLVSLARYLNVSKYESSVEQNAIWAISNKHSTASITHKCDSLVLPLRRLVAGIKGEVLPWYTMLSGTYMYSNGSIAVFPLLLQGKMQYSNEKESYATLRVLNEKGLPVCLVKSEWLGACVNKDYELAIPVKGLAKGKYTIELRSTEKELATKQFEI